MDSTRVIFYMCFVINNLKGRHYYLLVYRLKIIKSHIVKNVLILILYLNGNHCKIVLL